MHIDRPMNRGSVVVCNGRNGRWKIVKTMNRCAALEMCRDGNFVANLTGRAYFVDYHSFDRSWTVVNCDWAAHIGDACIGWAMWW